jgi:hypothetical protein
MPRHQHTVASRSARYEDDVKQWRAERVAAHEQLRARFERQAGELKDYLASLPPSTEAEKEARRAQQQAKQNKSRPERSKIREECAAQDREAEPHRGVRFDPRIGKFVARFYDRRTRRDLWLGAFPTAVEAGAAYQAHFAKAPKKPETNAEVYRRWKDTARHVAGEVAEGEVCAMPDGQLFELAEVFHNTTTGDVWWTEYHFASSCRECGKTYFFSTSPNPSGFTRNCPDHRRAGRGRRADAASKKLHEPEDGSDLI